MGKVNRRTFLGISGSLLASTALAETTKAHTLSATGNTQGHWAINRSAFHNQFISIELVPADGLLWQFRLDGSESAYSVTPPIIEIEGRKISVLPRSMTRIKNEHSLSNGVEEHIFEGTVPGRLPLKLRIEFQLHPDSSVLRFRYVLTSDTPCRMSKQNGMDSLIYFSTSFAGLQSVREVQFSQFLEQTHCYQLSEILVEDAMWGAGIPIMGPMLAGTNEHESFLTAYEHGSEVPNSFLHYELQNDKLATLKAVKGNYLSRQPIDAKHSFATVWFHVAAVKGGMDRLASVYRTFILRYQSQNLAMRTSNIFYNTWQFQTINKWNTNGGYLDSMHEERILKEIDVAHRLGVDVFVLDTGWYNKTGDWRVNTSRFSPHLKKVRDELSHREMTLGLWFGPTTVAVSSKVANEHPEWQMSKDGHRKPPAPVWETENSYQMCLVSDYSDAFADELIRVASETGVRYFKWDAVDQNGCNDPHHLHGDETNTPQERANSYAFQLIQKMGEVVDKLAAAVPGAIVDFDVTERGRAMGLSFLASGKYSLMNNGPYLNNYDIPFDKNRMNGNVFHHQGQARAWIVRSPLTYDRWLPSVLFLSHYYPNDPRQWQEVNVASLILGQNGIWGDLMAISEDGIRYIGDTLRRYKQVKEDITASDPVWAGIISGSPEVHEKISVKTGKGAVVLFATRADEYSYLTHNKVHPLFCAQENVQVTVLPSGRAKLTAKFNKPGATIIFFGAVC